MKKILLINGPNLNLLGERQPSIYGSITLAELHANVCEYARQFGIEIECFQSNHEGAIIDFLHENRKTADGVVLNAGALTHYSYALLDAIVCIQPPTVEVHISNIMQREKFRQVSVLEEACVKQYMGLGVNGYLRAVEYLVSSSTINKAKILAAKSGSRDDLLKDIVKLLAERHPKFNWTGIYLVEGVELVLHNYIGKPSPHTSIPIGRGICGAAVAQAESIIVPDVNADPRYLACSVETSSEIVVPIFQQSKVIGEIDIDSDLPDAFHEDDQQMLQEIAALIGSM